MKFGADTKVYGVDKEKEIREIRRKAINANLKLIECPIRHLGTEEGYKIYSRLQEHLLAEGVEMEFNTMVKDILIEDDQVKGVVTDKDETYLAGEVISAVGREGADWFSHICEQHGIETKVGTVDVGVRVEVRDEIMDFLNQDFGFLGIKTTEPSGLGCQMSITNKLTKSNLFCFGGGLVI